MNSKCDERHADALIPDYVLDLLAGEEHQGVSRHLASCRRCRLAVQQERQLLLAVRDTMSAATVPDPARLSMLKPSAPQSKHSLQPMWQKPLAATLLILLVILGSFALHARRSDAIWPAASPRSFMATAPVIETATDTPTLSATSTATEIARQSKSFPTPEPVRASDGGAIGAVLSPRPAVAPIAISPFLR